MKGYHLIYEVYGVDEKLLDDANRIMKLLKHVCKKAGMKVIKGDYHKFPRQGVTAFYILAESHISIHTWPEEGSAAIDIYYCGEEKSVRIAGEFLLKELKPKKVKERFLIRE